MDALHARTGRDGASMQPTHMCQEGPQHLLHAGQGLFVVPGEGLPVLATDLCRAQVALAVPHRRARQRGRQQLRLLAGGKLVAAARASLASNVVAAAKAAAAGSGRLARRACGVLAAGAADHSSDSLPLARLPSHPSLLATRQLPHFFVGATALLLGSCTAPAASPSGPSIAEQRRPAALQEPKLTCWKRWSTAHARKASSWRSWRF